MAATGGEMKSAESAAKLFEVLRAENIIEQHYERLPNRIRLSDAHLLDNLLSTYRETLISEMSTAYSDAELKGLADDISASQTLPEDFEAWLKQAIIRSLQTASDAHLNNRSGNADFRIESAGRSAKEVDR
jgi:hypothetical protein